MSIIQKISKFDKVNQVGPIFRIKITKIFYKIIIKSYTWRIKMHIKVKIKGIFFLN